MTFIDSQLTEQLNDHLTDLLIRAEADAVYLCDKGGNIVVNKVASEYANEDNIAALAAGSFSATNALANLLGEPGFNCIFHQSSNTSMYMQSLAGEMLLLVLFGLRSNPGLVKLHASEFAHVAAPVLTAMTSESVQAQQMAGFQVELDNSAQPFGRTQHAG